MSRYITTSFSFVSVNGTVVLRCDYVEQDWAQLCSDSKKTLFLETVSVKRLLGKLNVELDHLFPALSLSHTHAHQHVLVNNITNSFQFSRQH